MLLEPMFHICGDPAVIRTIAALKQIDAVFSIVTHVENFGPIILRFASPLREVEKRFTAEPRRAQRIKFFLFFAERAKNKNFPV